jgi:hypothetical protein
MRTSQMLAHHAVSSGRFVGAKRFLTCLRGLQGELDFETCTLFLVDPRWLVPCCNVIIVWLFKSVRTLLSQLLVTGGLLYGLSECQRWTG